MKIEKLIKEKSGIKLDIGCGRNKQAPDWVGIDFKKSPQVDIVQDLEEFPWKLPDECVTSAVCIHVIEHINPHKGVFIKFMDEIWRVLKYGAQCAFVTPFGGSRSYVQDPTHCNPCNQVTFSYFDPLDNTYFQEFPEANSPYKRYFDIYKPKPWKIEKLYWKPNGNIECIMSKRRIDKSYYE